MKEVSLARIKNERTAEYASQADFCRIFAADMNSLYLLSLLLTADSGKAEQCFVSGLNDCGGSRVFREWARSWARRTIIQNAIRLIGPRPTDASEISNRAQDVTGDQAPAVLRPVVSAVLELGSFERFVFIMSVFEGYSDQDCSLLLGCTRQTLIAARVRALQHIARSLELHGGKPADAGSKAEPVHDNKSIVELVAPVRLATPA